MKNTTSPTKIDAIPPPKIILAPASVESLADTIIVWINTIAGSKKNSIPKIKKVQPHNRLRDFILCRSRTDNPPINSGKSSNASKCNPAIAISKIEKNPISNPANIALMRLVGLNFFANFFSIRLPKRTTFINLSVVLILCYFSE